MASLPTQASRRRSSPSEQSSSLAPQEPNSQRPSTSTAQLRPILLNLQSTTSVSATPASPQPAPQVELRICWICQQDETEDEAADITWRTPCPCSLTAHDDCLLEWIANEESPKKGEIAHNHIIKCPQCQAEIQIQRPRDYLVAVVDRIQRTARNLILPTALSGIAGCFYSGLLVYGLNTMRVVFGPREARKILEVIHHREGNTNFGPNLYRLLRDTARWSLTAFDPFFPDVGSSSNLKIFLGLPLIGPSLVISRTRFADQAFALLLPLYFLDPSHRSSDLLNWPPTAGLTFATVPYLRTAYNELYRHTVSSYEKKWEAAVQRKPQEGETAEEIAQQARDEEGEPIFELEFVHDHVHGDEVNFAAPRRAQGENVNPGPPAANQIPADVAAAVNAAEAGQPAAVNDGNGGWEIRQDISATHLVSSAMGALFFPTVASLMGELLKVSLPAKWVDKNIGIRIAGRNGLLKEKWGRTLVGGCLFVVLKDVVTLYCKWKKARDFGKRKVLDYVGKKKTNA